MCEMDWLDFDPDPIDSGYDKNGYDKNNNSYFLEQDVNSDCSQSLFESQKEIVFENDIIIEKLNKEIECAKKSLNINLI